MSDNANLHRAVASYVSNVRSKAKALSEIKAAEREIARADINIKNQAIEAMKLAGPAVSYIDVGSDEVVVVSNTILEICPLTKGT